MGLEKKKGNNMERGQSGDLKVEEHLSLPEADTQAMNWEQGKKKEEHMYGFAANNTGEHSSSSWWGGQIFRIRERHPHPGRLGHRTGTTHRALDIVRLARLAHRVPAMPQCVFLSLLMEML